MKTASESLALVAFVALLAGCKSEQSTPVTGPEANSDAPIVMDEMPPMLDDAHAHPEHGPHGGELVELGKEAFHIEFVHDANGVVFYLLDGAVVDPVAIEAESLTVSLKHDNAVKTFELAASPQPDDPAGNSSRFATADPLFIQWMNAEAEGAVVVEINGKSYTGKIAHDHDHAGHNH